MNDFFHAIEIHGAPTALAVFLLALTWQRYNQLARRVQQLERENRHLLQSHQTATELALSTSTNAIERIAATLDRLTVTLATLPCQLAKPCPTPADLPDQ